jgi:DNA-binding transcriptional ArsR family regulator
MVRRPLVAVLVVCLAAALVAPAAAGPSGELDGGVTHAAGGATGGVAIDTIRSGASSSGLSRADTEGVLNQPTRAAVYDIIRQSPGQSLSSIAHAVGVAKSTVKYHVGVLREAGLVEEAVVAGTRRFAPAEADVEIAAVMGADATGAVLEAVAAHEPASVTTVAEATDRAASTASHHLSRLEERGLVERERSGEAVVATLAPTARRALADGPAPADD